MNSIMASLLVAACIFAGGLTGLYLNRILPERYLTRETQERHQARHRNAVGAGLLGSRTADRDGQDFL